MNSSDSFDDSEEIVSRKPGEGVNLLLRLAAIFLHY